MIFVMTVLEVQTNELFDSVARVWRNGRILPGAMVAVAALLAGGGCTQTILTAPQRSATEQLLLSTAAERAVASINFSLFSGKKVFLDVSNFDSYDSEVRHRKHPRRPQPLGSIAGQERNQQRYYRRGAERGAFY